MPQEGEPLQTAFHLEDVFVSSLTVLAEIEPTYSREPADSVDAAIAPTDPLPAERDRPKATIRDIRAVRSLLYNRLLLETVLKRIEKAEAIVLSYLLTQDRSAAQIGPYLVEVDPDNYIHLTMTDSDGWRQLHIPEPEEDFTK